MELKQPIQTASWAEHPNWAVVTTSEEWGHGVYSIHVAEYDATHNAKVTGGSKVPLDYVNGEVVTPLLVRKYHQEYLEKLCDLGEEFLDIRSFEMEDFVNDLRRELVSFRDHVNLTLKILGQGKPVDEEISMLTVEADNLHSMIRDQRGEAEAIGSGVDLTESDYLGVD